MRWIQLLEEENFSFTIYKLKRYDSIIIAPNSNAKNLLIILDGFINMLKVFTNNETLCLGLLTNNCIIQQYNITSKPINYYYKANAMTLTIVLSININSLIINKNTKNLLISYLVSSYSKTLTSYETIFTIYAQKNATRKIIQLLLILSEEFGNLSNTDIKIPFGLTHYSLSIIIGINRVNVTKIMNYLQSQIFNFIQ
uniref:Global nitrogen transcriptional regulator n=1 Tax=Sporolithon durum TaxID=48970 RepID=A0A141SD48_9FLOR|nr:global nitrogen transcriptional regulator [Sporolithon durum]AMK96216.1 global nitrogen transcriptional regulator [Sporolithon durum]